MRKSFIMAAVAASAVLVFGQLPGRAQAQTLEKVTFVLGFTPDGTYTNLIAIPGHGFGEAEGLDVNIITPGGTSDAAKLISSGVAQFGTGNATSVLAARSRGAPLVSLIAQNQTVTPGVLVTAESGIRSVKELEGKTIGITGIPVNRAMLETVLRANGVDLAKTKLIEVGFGYTAMLIAGKVDAAGDSIPYFDPIELNKARGKPLDDTSTYQFFPFYKFGAPLFYINSVNVNEEFLEKRGDIVRKFVKAWRAATEWAMKNPEEAVQVLVKRYPEIKYDVAVAEWKTMAPYMRSADTEAHGLGWQSPEVFSKMASFMYDNQLIKTRVDVTKAYTNAYFAAQ